MQKQLFFLVGMYIFFACCTGSNKKIDDRLRPAQGFLASLDTANYTLIEWKDSVQNFGTVQEGDSIKVVYVFKNVGDKPLFLSGVKTSCGCTIAHYPQQAILPGQEEKITASFNSRFHPGHVMKSIEVSSNTKNNIKHLLRLEGNVIKKETK